MRKVGEKIRYRFATSIGSFEIEGMILYISANGYVVEDSQSRVYSVLESEIIDHKNEDLRQKAALESAWERIARKKGFFA